VGGHRVVTDHVADLVQVSGDARLAVGAVRGPVEAQDLDVQFVVTLLACQWNLTTLCRSPGIETSPRHV
jgi:hypothetical protein